MLFAERFNTSKAQFDFQAPENTPFKKPFELVQENGLDKVYPLRSCYINKKGLYGDEPILITDDCFVNAPAHICDTITQVLKDTDAVKLINLGKVGFKFYEYQNKFGDQLGIEWVDL
mgnify:CR=1 FL=1